MSVERKEEVIIVVIYENGTGKQFKPNDSVRSLIDAIGRHDVDKIVVGDTTGGVVRWEKQFNGCTVMPPEFGGRSKTTQA